jgi:hypothetical protein
MSVHNTVRPWWWWLNPWLYAARRDRAYEDALDIISDIQVPGKETDYNPHSVAIMHFKAGRCQQCSRKYAKELIEEQP